MSDDASALPDSEAPSLAKLLRSLATAHVESFPEPNRAGAEETINLHAPLPTEQELVQLLRVTTVANALEEEGWRVPIALAFVPIDAAGDGFLAQTARFAAPIPFDPQHLVKIAVATDPNTTQVGVYRGGGGLEIWGLLRGINPFPRSKEFNIQAPNHLVVRAPRPAMITVQYLGTQLLTWSAGQLLRHGGGVDIAAELIRVVAAHWPEPLKDPENVVAKCVWELAVEILALRRGGTLLVVPADLALGELFDSWREFKQPVPVLRELIEPNEKRRAVEFLGALTQADGAVVLDSRLNALAFGAMIKSVSSTISIAGARHRSAQGFVDALPPGASLAIVCSHEGDVSAYWKNGGGLQTWTAVGASVVPIEW